MTTTYTQATFQPDSRFSLENIREVSTSALLDYHRLAEWTRFESITQIDAEAWDAAIARLEAELTARRRRQTRRRG